MTSPDIFVMQGDATLIDLEAVAQCDVMITDPPYGAHVHANATSNRTGGAGVVARDLGFASLTLDLQRHVAHAAGVVKRWSVVFCDFESTHVWRDLAENIAEAEYIRTIPWVRWSQPQLSGDRPPTGAEATLVFHATNAEGKPQAKHWNGSGGLMCWDQHALRGKDKHPTEKPFDLMLAIVSAFSDPGETVYDPCAGAGTTALACALLGRGCVGVELDGDWARRAEARATGPLSARDSARAKEWAEACAAEAQTVPKPYADKSGVEIGRPSWERSRRRLADAARVLERIKG